MSVSTRNRPRVARGWFRSHPAATGAAVVLAALVLVALAAPLLSGDPNAFHPDAIDPALGGLPRGPLGGVGAHHPFGVEPGTGRDLYARAVHGARVSLGVALGATVLQVLVGSLVGLAAGYAGGWVDAVLARAMDVTLALPGLVLAVALLGIVPAAFPRPVLLTGVIGLLGWGGIGRMVRGQVIAHRRREYVDAARLLGASGGRIALREIAPNLATPVIAYATLLIPGNVLSEAGLSFLGVGIRPPTPSWGQMLSGAARWFVTDPMYVLVPGGLLLVTVLAFNLLGDAVRDTLDPKSTR